MKTNFHNTNFAPSLAFIMRFTATRKWPIAYRFVGEINDLRDIQIRYIDLKTINREKNTP